MRRDYYGLPLTLASEDPEGVRAYVGRSTRGDYDVGRLGLTVSIADSDPYYAGVICQHGKAVAVVDCLGSKDALVKALAEDSLEKLAALGIQT